MITISLHTNSKVILHSSDHELEKGFDRLKQQALYFVYEGYPVGDYYEAALPNRDAFCMRDVSHQCTGAEVLGLSNHNLNMFRWFAKSISESRDWCSHWEIDRFGRSCPVDYTSDADFWYNLPANFDVLHACWRMYQWTGDESYISGPEFDRFHSETMENYISRWDRDGDGLPDRRVEEGRRGLCTYDESRYATKTLKTASDLLAVMARAHLSFADMCSKLGRKEQEAIYRLRGESLMRKLNDDWYDPDKGYAKGIDTDGNMVFLEMEHAGTYTASYLLYWDALNGHFDRLNALLDAYYDAMPQVTIEPFSHYPELLWRYGRPKSGLAALRRAMSPDLPRKEYPELSFCAVGAAATGLMGIRPDAVNNCIVTRPGLSDVKWAQMSNIPVLGGEITVRHDSSSSTFTRVSGPDVLWQARFTGDLKLAVDGCAVPKRIVTNEFTGVLESCADIPVPMGQTRTVSIIT